MTPLAYRIVKELTLPPKRRTFIDRCGLLDQMQNVHCFEVSQIYDAAVEMLVPLATEDAGAQPVPEDRMEAVAGRTSFLPAPKTWIEFEAGGTSRLGFLLEEQDGFAVVQLALQGRGHFGSEDMTFVFGLGARGVDPGYWNASLELDADDEIRVGSYVGALNAILAFINTPKIIGREEFPPHRGLGKKLKAALGAKSDFVIHPWTEIRLQVTPPEPVGDADGANGHLTGQRALHFCRSHLRFRNGRLEIVRAHWRGSIEAGFRPATYRVTP